MNSTKAGDPKIIKHLNTILGNELIAINQYFLHSKMLKDWGFSKLGQTVYEESIDEMKHADWLAERILFLGGLPNFQDLGKLFIGQTVKEILECDLKLEHKAIPDLKAAIVDAEAAKDFVTRDLLQKILSSEEEHQDFIETQLGLLQKLGEPNYLQSQV